VPAETEIGTGTTHTDHHLEIETVRETETETEQGRVTHGQLVIGEMAHHDETTDEKRLTPMCLLLVLEPWADLEVDHLYFVVGHERRLIAEKICLQTEDHLPDDTPLGEAHHREDARDLLRPSDHAVLPTSREIEASPQTQAEDLPNANDDSRQTEDSVETDHRRHETHHE
jgi:hypothetical protein